MSRFATFTAACLLALFALVAPTQQATAQGASEAQAIEETILSQIAAMQDDDWIEAFTFASPTIQGIFQTPENFSRMVTSGYPMVWRPKSFRPGVLTSTPQGPMKTMFFVDQQDRLYIADYLMQLIDGEWRINGVQIRPAPEQNV